MAATASEGPEILRVDLNRSIRALLARAAALAATEPVWLRVAHGHAHWGPDASPLSQRAAREHSAPELDAVYYLDLADAARHVIEIRAEGCRVVTDPPVWLRRPTGERPLPMPRWHGSIDRLKKYVNLSDADFWLFAACLTAALRPHGSYPILFLAVGINVTFDRADNRRTILIEQRDDLSDGS
jgi:hypothetical protein